MRLVSRRTCWPMATTFARREQLFGHKDVRTTMIYTHVFYRGGQGVQSPADSLPSLPAAR